MFITMYTNIASISVPSKNVRAALRVKFLLKKTKLEYALYILWQLFLNPKPFHTGHIETG